MLSLEQINEKALWVVRYDCGYRKVGTYAECEANLERDYEEIKDFDLCAEQPEEVRDFFDVYFEYLNDYHTPYMDIEEYYTKIYSKETK